MKSNPVTRTLSLAVLAAFAGTPALAADPGWYGGVSAGPSRAEVNDMNTFTHLLGGGYSTVTLNHDHRDTGYKVFGGYQFNRNFALEGGYFDLGKFGFTTTTLPAGTLSGEYKFRGVNFDAVGILPLTERFSALARVGVNYTEAKDQFSGTGAVTGFDASASKHDTSYKYGLGLKYELSQRLALMLEGERYRINNAVGSKNDVDLYTLGVVYHFGGKSSAHVAQSLWPPAKAEPEAAPAPAAAPMPAPAPIYTVSTGALPSPGMVIVPTAQPTEQYCSILDIQFEIDQDAIQREEKEKLAVVGTFMNKYPSTTAVIEGHTDNVGSAEHNQQLSQNRAESVVTYLQNQLRIAPSRLSAVGYGATRPIADNQSEAGKRENRRIDAVIACATDIEGLNVAPARVTMALLIEFDHNQTKVRPEYDNELRKVANFLKANPSLTATVEGHTGNLQGTPEEAMVISQQRAQNVVNALVDEFGISRTRLAVEGFGETRRYAYNTSLEGQQENRRVNIIFNYGL